MVWRVGLYDLMGAYRFIHAPCSLFPLQPILKIKKRRRRNSPLFCVMLGLCLDATLSTVCAALQYKEHKRSTVDIEKEVEEEEKLLLSYMGSTFLPTMAVAKHSAAAARAALTRFLTVRHGRLDDE